MKLVITSAYCNPIHKGHIECFNLAKSLGDKLVVILNNDTQVKIKKDIPFMDIENRLFIVKNLRCVDDVFVSIDEDKTVCNSIECVFNAETICGKYTEVIFAKGGDRNIGNIPEKAVCDRLGIKIVDGLGDKIISSSSLLDKYYYNRLWSSSIQSALKQGK